MATLTIRITQVSGCGVPNTNSAFTSSSLGWTPLHEACNRGHTQAVRVLIKFGAEVNALSECATTPLVDACANNHLHIVRVLLENGADPRIKNNYGHTALSVVTHPVIRGLLLENLGLTEEPNTSEEALEKEPSSEDTESASENATTTTAVPTTSSDTSGTDTVEDFPPENTTELAPSSSSSKLGITSISEFKSVIRLITPTSDSVTGKLIAALSVIR